MLRAAEKLAPATHDGATSHNTPVSFEWQLQVAGRKHRRVVNVTAYQSSNAWPTVTICQNETNNDRRLPGDTDKSIKGVILHITMNSILPPLHTVILYCGITKHVMVSVSKQ